MSDVFELLLARVLERDVELPFDVLPHLTGNTYSARLGDPFQTHRDVHPITEDVASVYDNVADIDADAELNLPILCRLVRGLTAVCRPVRQITRNGRASCPTTRNAPIGIS